MIIYTGPLQILHFSFHWFSFSLLGFCGLFWLLPDHFCSWLVRPAWAILPWSCMVNCDLQLSPDPTEAKEEVGHFLGVFWRLFWSCSAPAVFRLGVSFLAFEGYSRNFCSSSFSCCTFFPLGYVSSGFRPYSMGLCGSFLHLFSFGIAPFMGFLMLALTL